MYYIVYDPNDEDYIAMNYEGKLSTGWCTFSELPTATIRELRTESTNIEEFLAILAAKYEHPSVILGTIDDISTISPDSYPELYI
jgi:hypothetical protein